MRNLTGLHTDEDVVRDVSYFTFVITDMQHRSGGNPFDNRETLYVGTTPGSSLSDEALNDGVRRYGADESARRYLVAHYTPTGKVTKPMLAVHTTYDPLIPGWTLSRYHDLIAEAGYSENFVQQYVHREGHCAISPRQVGESLDELTDWVKAGKKPRPDSEVRSRRDPSQMCAAVTGATEPGCADADGAGKARARRGCR